MVQGNGGLLLVVTVPSTFPLYVERWSLQPAFLHLVNVSYIQG